MNSDYEKRLEQEIDAALKALPELEAPARLANRVFSRTSQRLKVPWYHKSWEMWPAGLRFAALGVMLGGFGALCFASWELTKAAGFNNAVQEVGRLFSGLAVVWNVVNAVLSGLALAIKHLHPAIMAGCFALFVFAWSTCVGLGTAFVKLAKARR